MVPALLPAFSAPTGVSVDLSLVASSALTAARAGAQAASRAASSKECFAFFVMVCLTDFLKGAGNVEGHEVAVLQGLAERQHSRGRAGVRHGERVLGTKEGRIADADVPGVLVLGLD